MAPVSTRSAVLADPEYVFDRFTPKKRRSSRRAVDKEDTLKKQKLDREKVHLVLFITCFRTLHVLNELFALDSSVLVLCQSMINVCNILKR